MMVSWRDKLTTSDLCRLLFIQIAGNWFWRACSSAGQERVFWRVQRHSWHQSAVWL